MGPERRLPDPSSLLGTRGECLLYIVLLAGIVWFPFAAALNAGADHYPVAGPILATANLVMAILGIAFLLVIAARAAPHTRTAAVVFGDYLALLALCAYDSLAHLVAHHLLPTLLDTSTRIFGPNLTSYGVGQPTLCQHRGAGGCPGGAVRRIAGPPGPHPLDDPVPLVAPAYSPPAWSPCTARRLASGIE